MAKQEHERRAPAFEKGNQAARRHGAFSPPTVDNYAQMLVQDLLAQKNLHYLRDESFRDPVWRWATRRAQSDLLYAHVVKHQVDTLCAGCKRCLAWEERWQRFDATAERAAATLGLDPDSRSDILARLANAGLYSPSQEAVSMLGRLAQALGVAADQMEEDRPTIVLDQVLDPVTDLDQGTAIGPAGGAG